MFLSIREMSNWVLYLTVGTLYMLKKLKQTRLKRNVSKYQYQYSLDLCRHFAVMAWNYKLISAQPTCLLIVEV